ncbi:MAG TPA: hypothetical protein VJH65_00655 [Candidatus Nanoarchaeia archaeon]|nr:hypothetical protein [Candidatus Nanoarchaeia archaeon]
METKNVLVVLAGALVLSLIVSLAVVGGFKGTGYAVGDTTKVTVPIGSKTFNFAGASHTIRVTSIIGNKIEGSFDGQKISLEAGTSESVTIGNKIKVISAGVKYFYRKSAVFQLTEVDINPPKIVDSVHESYNLKITTDENARCIYSEFNCVDSFDDENLIIRNIDGIEHYLPWNTEKTYYIKCRDIWGNRNSECAVIKPSDIFGTQPVPSGELIPSRVVFSSCNWTSFSNIGYYTPEEIGSALAKENFKNPKTRTSEGVIVGEVDLGLTCCKVGINGKLDCKDFSSTEYTWNLDSDIPCKNLGYDQCVREDIVVNFGYTI